MKPYRPDERRPVAGGLCAASLLGLVLAGCSDGGGGAPAASAPPPPPAPQNADPIADAGPDQSVVEDQTVFLTAAGSRDPDGAIATFRWRQIAGPAIDLQDDDRETARLRAPEAETPTALTFEVTVTDDDGAVATDTVEIVSRPDPVDEAPRIILRVDGERRVYILYTPESYTPGNPAFLILHGGGQSMRTILEPDPATRRWVEQADREGFLLIVPNGFSESLGSGLTDVQSWNDIRDDNSVVGGSQRNDVRFLLAVLDDARARSGFDPDRVYVAGASNGGIMTMTLLIEVPERFAAGAAYIAALPEEAVPEPAAPTPLMMLNGTEDPLILFDGGPVAVTGAPTRSVPDTVDYWIAGTGSDPATEGFTSLPNTVPDDGCAITQSRYSDRVGGSTRFVYYEAVGGGHSIPDPTPQPLDSEALQRIGGQCQDVHGVDLAVDFFLGRD